MIILKRSAWFLLVTCLLFYKAGAQAVSLQQGLNGTWSFRTDPDGEGEKRGWFADTVNTTGWDSMAVPGNWDLRNEYAHYVGKAWYYTRFTAQPGWRNSWVRIIFEAVNHSSKVWLNGKLLGSNNSGYLPFEFDITSLLRYDRPNTIIVSADNTFSRGALWNWGGIRRPVTLVSSGQVYIVHQFISPQVDLEKKTAAVEVRVQLKNNTDQPVDVQGEVVLSAGNGFKRTLPFNTMVKGAGITEAIVRTELNKEQIHLWSCDDPFLYQSNISIKNSKGIAGQLTDRFGLRKIEVDNKNYTFKLNGEPVRLMGFNLVPDDRTTGNTLPLWRVKEDIDLMKSLGGNMARLTHLPLHKEMFDYLDEKGMLVVSEIPLWGLDALANKNNPVPKEWLKRLITTHYDHPSIIAWGVGNEIGHTPGVMEYVDEAIQYARSLDNTRLSVMVSHTAEKEKDPIDYSDLGLINKYGIRIGSLTDQIHNAHPGKLLFYTEYGYGQLREDLDADVDARGMIDSIRFKPYLMGASLWTFNDYRSHYIGTKEFSGNRPWGIVDVFRQKKEAWYSFKKEYAPVRALKINLSESNKDHSATITLTPRQLLDLPAYPLHNYSLVWKWYNAKGMLLDGGFLHLPDIYPGDHDLQFPIRGTKPADAFSLQVGMLSPLDYFMADTTVFFQPPPPPKILYAMGVRAEMNDIRENSGRLQIVFEKNPYADHYQLQYGKDAVTNQSALTRNSYIIVPRLSFGDVYQLHLTGVNGSGKSDPAVISNVKIGTAYPPPLITYTEPADKGFYVGYTTEQDDYLFQVGYTTKQGDYSDSNMLQTTNRGVLFVPGLVNGQHYYYRLRRWKHNSYISEWSEEIAVTPDGGTFPPAPVLSGIIRQGTEAIVCFEPVKKTTGYSLQYRNTRNREWITHTVNASQIGHYKITGLDPHMAYEFRMAALNANGQSEYSVANLHSVITAKEKN